ncbi:MAG: divalent cation tolerance protein CutA [Thermoplasmatota archaeon]
MAAIIVVTAHYPRREDIPRLGACRSIRRVESEYVWEGRVCTGEEWEVSFKCTHSQRARLVKAILASHPDEVPYVAWRAEMVTAAYARWAKRTPALESMQ